MATRQATVWFLLRRTFPKFAFSISATRTQGKVLPVSGPLWCIVLARAFPLHKMLSSCKARARANLTGSQWTILSGRKGMAGTRPSFLLQFWLRGSGRHGGAGFNTSLASLERNQEAVAPWPVGIQPGKRGYKQTQGLLGFVSFVLLVP